MIDFEQRGILRSAQRFLGPFKRPAEEISVRDFQAVVDFLLAHSGGTEALLNELCSWEDRELDSFLGASWRSGVPEARELAAQLLMRRGCVGLVFRLEEILRDEDGARWLTEVLSEVDDDESTRLLIQMLDHGELEVRRAASRGLYQHRTRLDAREFVRHLARPLVQQLAHPQLNASVRCLHRIADRALEPDFGKDAARRAERVLINCVRHETRASVRGDAVAALGEIGSKSAVRCLVDMLAREDASFHREVVIALRKIHPQRALMALLGLLQSRDPIIREEAANALGAIGNPRAVKRLRVLLDDENADVRQEAVLALGRLGGREVLVSLEKALQDPDPSVRISACSALALSLGDRAQGKLIRALYDTAAGVRSEAAFHLGSLGDEGVRVHLEGRLLDLERDGFGEPVAREARRSIFRIDLMAARRKRALR